MSDSYLKTLRKIGSSTDIYFRVYEGDLFIGILDKKENKWHVYEFDNEEFSSVIKFLTNNPIADQPENTR